MADKKSFSGSETVLKCIRKVKSGTEKFEVTPDSFSNINFKGVAVEGEKYYVDKAVKAGATK